MKSILVVLTAMFIVSCASTEATVTLPVEERYQKAKALFDDESYLQAAEEFKIITVQFQGSEYADEAQFYLAECRYRRGEYILASAEYDNLVRLMPGSPFTNLARYMRAEAYYQLSPKPQLDQKYSRLALDNFQTYIEFSPKDSMVADAERKISELTLKLAQKMFDGGLLYYRMEYYRAAIAYFDKLIQEYHDSPFADDGMLWKARSQNERKDFSGAVQTIQELRTKHPGTDLTPEIAELEKKITEDKAEYEEDQRLRQTTLTE
ncbi:MAG: outer membrane protein assembly factor BamD [Bacteroidetes bacterium]|nr:outer membrane protein assembly factor BamD [Bacteroidota bacterium]